MKRSVLIFVFILMVIFSTPAGALPSAQEEINKTPDQLVKLSLEQLMDIQITSVSKKEESQFKSAAAIYVLTREDFRRLGVTTIPEALRRVPGVEVAQFNSSTWGITARGFNGIFANKLLVLLDGRSLYNNLFGGVYWDIQDTVLEDIERIEIIRGPGGTLWGENAVNGVINIITRRSENSQGVLVTAGGGSQENGTTTIRYGGALNEKAHYRVYGKYFNRSDFPNAAGIDQNDQWEQGRGGFRADWDPSEDNAFTLQGDFYKGQSSQNTLVTRLTPPGNQQVLNDNELKGGNLLGRWSHNFSPDSKLTVKTYFDNAYRKETSNTQDIYTWDTEIQHDLNPFENHDLSWGVFGRLIVDDLVNTSTRIANPTSQTNYIAGFFLQDTYHLIPERLRLIYGSKFGWNSFTGFEVQPNARFSWTPDDRHTVWGAVSRAVRIPNRTLESTTTNLTAFPITGGRTVVSLFPNPNSEAENLSAFEIGFRQKLASNFQWDVSFFYNIYSDLTTLEAVPAQAQGTFPNLQLNTGTQFANKANAESFGVEWTADWRPLNWWTLKSSFSWLDLNVTLDRDSGDTVAEIKEGSSPAFQYKISSQMDLPYNLELDTHLYFVDELPRIAIPGYARLDLRLGWRPVDSLKMSLSIQNLTDNLHPEFSDIGGGLTPSEIPRAAFGSITWTY